MKLYEISLKSIQAVKSFVDLTTIQPFEIDVLSGRYVVDGKSIMAIFSIDLTETVRVRVHGMDEQAEAFLHKLKAISPVVVELPLSHTEE